MKNVILSLALLFVFNSFSQCPDKSANYFIKQAETKPTERNNALAKYYTDLCPCINGSYNVNELKKQVNESIDLLNKLSPKRKPMPFILRCKDSSEPTEDNYIEWQGKKENFTNATYSGNMDHMFPQQLHLRNEDNTGNLVKQNKKFQYIRISGFKELKDNEEITLSANQLKHVGIIDIENDNYYYTAKSATLKGLGKNRYQLEADFHFTGSAGNTFQDKPGHPNYTLKAFFGFNPFFEMN